MKHTIHFKTVEEMNNYFPEGVPNNFLAIVQEEDSEEAVLYTSSNNYTGTGKTESQGGYIDSPVAVDKSEEILYGDDE